jgi:hypothetical protein
VSGPEPGDRGVVRAVPAGDHPESDVAHAAALQLARGAHALAVAVEQQRGHQRRVERRTTLPVGPISSTERRKVALLDRINDQPDQIVCGQPVPHVRCKQELLVTVRTQETLRHA